MNTVSLIHEATRIRDLEIDKARAQFDEIWVVFDRDSFPADKFNEAVRLAEQARFQVAYSNQAFELWYLLHFDYCDSALHRSSYAHRLTERMGRYYTKSADASQEMFGLLRSRLPEALKNARKLYDRYGDETPEKRDPCTTVHLLVEKLLANSVD